MRASVHHDTARIRVAAAIALVWALSIAYAVILGYGDGGWPLLIPAFAAATVLVFPRRRVLFGAIAVTAMPMLLGAMTAGMFYGVSLAALIYALAEFRKPSGEPRG